MTDKRPNERVTSDSRFSSLHNDPRFNLPRRKQTRVTMDKRFQSKIAGEDSFKQRTSIDKYGRKIVKESNRKELGRYYNLEDDEEEEEEEEETSKAVKAHKQVEESDSSQESELEDTISVLDRARGEGVDSDATSEEESDSDSSSDSDLEDEVVGEIQSYDIQEDIPEGDETDTLAVVNLDWDNVRATDVMATLSSFVPKEGRIISVQILPSEYGKMRMDQENVEGPPRDLFDTSNSKKRSSKKGKKGKSGDDEDEITAESIIQEDSGEEVDSSSLRNYQLQRLRYYYAVVRCDSVRTARAIYESCDGTEYESTANFFDMRYVPEDMDFDEDIPRDECTKLPSDYRPNNFVTDALQHSKVKLTWDETPAERVKMATRAFSQKDLDEMDFKAYLASDSEEEDRDAIAEKYRSLLSGNGNEFAKLTKSMEKDGDDIDMEITFTPGLNDTKSGEDGEEDEETTIEKYRRKEKERRKKRLERMKETKSESESAAKDKPNDKSGKIKTKAKSKLSVEDEKAKAELELLLMDEQNEKDQMEHFDMREILKAEKKMKKAKKAKKQKSGQDLPAGMDFKVDVKDPRFQELFESHEFAIDPSHSHFKKTAAMENVLQERRRRTARVESPGPADGISNGQESKKRKRREGPDGQQGGKELKSLVEKIKRKSKA